MQISVFDFGIDLTSVLIGLSSGSLLGSIVNAVANKISVLGTRALKSGLAVKLLPFVTKAFNALDETLIDQLTITGTAPNNILLVAKQAVEEVSDGKLTPEEVMELGTFLIEKFSIARFIEKVGTDD